MSALPNTVVDIDLKILNRHFDDADPTVALKWAVDTLGAQNVVLASSFGAEDVALIHLACQLDERPRVFTLDTGRLHQETHDVADRLRKRYDLEIEVYVPDASSLQGLLTNEGPNSFYDSIAARKRCCHIRKVEPLKRVLDTSDAWITGLRREQSVTRSGISVIELDEANGGIYKLNPLAAWSEDDVWDLIKTHGIPYNALHDRGFPSIGCAPCTRAIGPNEDVRAGRWWWENPELRECGLHLKTGPSASSGP